MKEIKLGSEVRCKITGLIGIAVCRTKFLNGCVQYGVAPKVSKHNLLQEEVNIDEESLEVIPVQKKIIKESKTGGPTRRGIHRRNY